MKTFTPKPADLTHDWYIIDAKDVVLGRLSVAAANLLRGKNKPTFAPHADSGNYVIIINADKIALTGDKMDKELYSHSGRPGGLRRDSYAELLKNKPERIIMHAVKGMLPKNKLAKQGHAAEEQARQGPADPSARLRWRRASVRRPEAPGLRDRTGLAAGKVNR